MYFTQVDSLSESSIGQEQNIKNLTSLIPTGGINPKLCSYDFAGNSRSAGQDLYNLYTNYAPSYDLTPSLQVWEATHSFNPFCIEEHGAKPSRKQALSQMLKECDHTKLQAGNRAAIVVLLTFH